MPEAPYLLVLNAAEGVIQYLIARVEPAPPAAPSTVAPVPPAFAPVPPAIVPAPPAASPTAPGPAAEAHSFFAPGLNATLHLLCAHDWHAPSQGAELLAPALAHSLERLNIRPGDIGRIACVRGPGSFTGLRLVLATAAGLARTTGALQGGISYLPLLAQGAATAWETWNSLFPAPCPQPGSPMQAPGPAGLPQPLASPVYWVLTHARRNLVHAQACTRTPEGVLPASDILVLSLEEAARHIAASPSPCVVLGSGATKNNAALRDLLASAPTTPLFLPPDFDHLPPMLLLRAAALCSYGKEDVAPLYARPCDAEENLGHIAATLRIDPEQARAQLTKLTTTQG